MIKDESVDKLAQAIREQQERKQAQRELVATVSNLKNQPYHGKGYYVIGTIKKKKSEG